MEWWTIINNSLLSNSLQAVSPLVSIRHLRVSFPELSKALPYLVRFDNFTYFSILRAMQLSLFISITLYDDKPQKIKSFTINHFLVVFWHVNNYLWKLNFFLEVVSKINNHFYHNINFPQAELKSSYWLVSLPDNNLWLASVCVSFILFEISL